MGWDAAPRAKEASRRVASLPAQTKNAVLEELSRRIAEARYASNHTEAILTRTARNAEEFAARVTSSVVMVNASTRFNDGFQLGLGAEIGISTTKLHAYGPMGLEELTTQRYVVEGDGHTR